MDDQEIAQRIEGLSDEARNGLYGACQAKKDAEDHPGGDVAVYVEVQEAVADELSAADLVWRRNATSIAARFDVYRYWERHVMQDA